MLDAQLEARARREEDLTEYLTKKKGKQRETTDEQPPPLDQTPNSSPIFTQLPPDQRRTESITTHKQGIISAMENTHLPKHPEYRITTAPQLTKSRSDPLPSARLLTPLPKDYTVSQNSEQYNSASRTTDESITQVERRAVGLGKKIEETQHQLTNQKHHSDNTMAYYDELTHVRTGVIPGGTSNETASEHDPLLPRIYSSKPPSRYGPRPGPDDGVPPSTVSIMLTRRPRSTSRPATIHCSSRRRKHSHNIHYFTNRTLQ
ncbi:hypothetical protein GBAR_LOCUS4935 [Geodia barretti]|uniref:Uncharacterized protein n=1 Tax=Geodia barretti TaxID=519541 RepID=A0AA35R8M9_GEOBA|nr:hypothetical protein GBAR_LOCUS4935 [Geodia barretti]